MSKLNNEEKFPLLDFSLVILLQTNALCRPCCPNRLDILWLV